MEGEMAMQATQVVIDPAQYWAIGLALFGLASEVVGANKKWKSNTVVQLVFKVLGRIFGKK